MTAATEADRRARLERWHAEMMRLRAFEEAVAEAHAASELPGLLHLSMGAEAVAVAIFDCLEEHDRVFSSHRPHSHFLAGGVDPRLVMAELAGRQSGLCHGRAGTMHLMSDRIVMATGIVGGTLPVALGYAMTRSQPAVVACFFGDGAVQTGAFHETMNLAALWKAPVLFVCENNGWAEFSSRDEHTTVGNVVRYGELYGIPAREVDGSDPEAVRHVAAELLEPMRTGAGPALLECHIARLRSHYEGDWREQTSDGDPLLAVEQLLSELGVRDDEINDVRTALLADARELCRSVLADDDVPDPDDDAAMVFASPLTA